MSRLFVVSMLLVLLLLGCQGEVPELETPVPVAEVAAAVTDTPVPTDTSEPTATAVPTDTATPEPTATAVPTNTPEPAEPTATTAPVKARPTTLPGKQLTPIPTSRPLVDNTVDVFAIIDKAQTVTEQAKSVHLWTLMSVEVSGFMQNLEMDCDVETFTGESGEPLENSYCQAQMVVVTDGEQPGDSLNFEMIQRGNEAWARLEGEEEWTPAPQNENSFTMTDQLAIEDLEPYLLDAQIVGETEMDGTVVYEIVFDA